MMVENKPHRTILTHGILILGIAVIIFPLYITLVASTHQKRDIATTVQPWFGDHLIENYATVLKTGKKTAGGGSSRANDDQQPDYGSGHRRR